MGSGKKMHSVYVFLYPLTWASVLHAILIMVQATTLNVAFNSHNKSLLTIMMSNNVSTHVPPLRFSVFVFYCWFGKKKYFLATKPCYPFFTAVSDVFVRLVFFGFFCHCSLLRSKGACLRSLRRITSFRCPTVVSNATPSVYLVIKD